LTLAVGLFVGQQHKLTLMAASTGLLTRRLCCLPCKNGNLQYGLKTSNYISNTFSRCKKFLKTYLVTEQLMKL